MHTTLVSVSADQRPNLQRILTKRPQSIELSIIHDKALGE